MHFRKIACLVLLVCGLFSSCKEDPISPIDPVEPTPYEIPKKVVSASLSGLTLDEAGDPLANAVVRVGTQSITSDENGIFYFRKIAMNGLGTLVEVEKDGYFNSFKMVTVESGRRASIRIVMATKTEVGTVEAAQGGTLEVSGGSKISLPAQGMVTEAGVAYDGMVKVSAKWMSPDDPNTNVLMPGDLRAIDNNQSAVQLATFGMLNVELEDANGNALQLAVGSSAQLEIPVPAALRSSAPASIPLWHFDEATGFWVEEGSASFDGTRYVGEVGHFSTWNFDIPFEKVNLEGLVTDQDGNPLADMELNIRVNSSLLSRTGYTDDAGAFSGGVPKDEELQISLFAYGWCENEIYSATIGPFDADVVLPTIVIDFSTLDDAVLLAGSLEDCAGNLLLNSYLKVSQDGGATALFGDDNGDISGTIFYCNTSQLDLEGYDLTNAKKSSVASYDVSGLSELDFGSLSVCDDLVEFFNYTIDGESYSVLDPFTSVPGMGALRIDGIQPIGSSDSLVNEIILDQLTIGVHNPRRSFFSGQTAGAYYVAWCNTIDCLDFEVTLTAVGAIGESIEGTFTGEILNNIPGNITPSTVSGSFKVIRDF